MSGAILRVTKCPSESLAYTNCFIVNPRNVNARAPYAVLNDRLIVNLRADDGMQPDQIGTSMLHRRWAGLSLNEEAKVVAYNPFGNPKAAVYAMDMALEVGFAKRGMVLNEALDAAKMTKMFLKSYENQILTVGSQILFEFEGIVLLISIGSIENVDEKAFRASIEGRELPEGVKASSNIGFLTPQTNLLFHKGRDSGIKLKADASKPTINPLMQPNFKFEDLGIGGLKDEFSAIFRRAFASRIFPSAIVEKMGIQHVKGILLYGPPGTGKTLMARQIGKMLNSHEPLIVNGPEVLNKFVGASEENVRKLFGPAEQEYKERGDESQLHIIIFDELDAICRQRGSKSDSTGVGDSIVNQLLAKLDGVDQLNNILLIGMTNRKDMIDEALLRPGRLEVHMEINLPDENGRLEIVHIHTAKMRSHNLLGSDVDLKEIAGNTKNFSGAEIFGLVKSASSFAFNRHVKVGQNVAVSADLNNIKVVREDFLAAMTEVHAAFGASEAELKLCVQNGIIRVGPTERILADGDLLVKQVRASDRTPLVTALLHGPAGSGKTALGATIAMSSDYPFIKLISPETMIGMSESQKIGAIHKVFSDAFKSDLSVILIDDLERLLDWVPIGPRFSNNVLQALMILLNKQPPPGRRLLVIATATQKHVLDSLDLTNMFDSEIYVPPVQSLADIEIVVDKIKLFSSVRDQRRALDHLKSSRRRFQVSMKKLIMCAEMARQDEDRIIEKFITTMMEVAAVGKAESNTDVDRIMAGLNESLDLR